MSIDKLKAWRDGTPGTAMFVAAKILTPHLAKYLDSGVHRLLEQRWYIQLEMSLCARRCWRGCTATQNAPRGGIKACIRGSINAAKGMNGLTSR